MTRTLSASTAAELWRLLSHARGCDGLRPDPLSGKLSKCPTCDQIDRRLEDGAPYFADDPAIRADALDRALAACIVHGTRIAEVLDTSTLLPATRSAQRQLIGWMERTRALLTLPIHEIPGAPRPTPQPPQTAPAPPRPTARVVRIRRRRRDGPVFD